MSIGFDRIEDLDTVSPARDFQREALPYEAGRYGAYFPSVELIAPPSKLSTPTVAAAR